MVVRMELLQMTLTFGSLFSGIGGIDLGLEAAGMECRWQVEIDEHCLMVLDSHWPEVPKYEDVRNLSGGTLETVDLICGGFPCQPVSVSGKRKGTSDPRWLWPEFFRLVGEIRPEYVFVENVPAITSQGGVEVVADLASISYNSEWHILPAGAFGAPHLRERFILVAHTGSTAPQLDNATSRQEWVPPIALQPTGLPSGNWTVDAKGRVASSLLTRWENVIGDSAPSPWIQGVDDGPTRKLDKIRERMIGNAVVPIMAQYVGERILEDRERKEWTRQEQDPDYK